LKLTPQRLAIVRELAADPTHPTAQELYERLRPSMPSMSFATVYNTLDALAARGLCSVRALSPGASRFDPNMKPHDHLVCDECGAVRDLVPQREKRARRSISRGADGSSGGGEGAVDRALAMGFVVRSVEQIYRGLCAACASADAHSPKDTRSLEHKQSGANSTD
jgi:Fur family peroxide stress response transcriptional regulator